MNHPQQEQTTWTDEQVSAALHRAKLKLETLRDQLCEPLAVIGMGCRFPQASGPDRFWELLKQGRCAVTETPAERWDGSLTASVVKEPGKVTANRGAFLDSVDQFDASFFDKEQAGTRITLKEDHLAGVVALTHSPARHLRQRLGIEPGEIGHGAQ